MLPSRAEILEASHIVYSAMQPTPQYRWPLLDEHVGSPVWVKHENHAPTGAFKVRGGLVYLHHLAKERGTRGIVTATRGNHGQSVGFAARTTGLPVTVVVPRGNAVEKNAAMRALGVELVEYGDDFQDAISHADGIAEERGWHRLPSFHPWLLAGVATWATELLSAAQSIAALYVPIGLGSGLCGALAAREALGLDVELVGVVSSGAPAYARSLAERRPVSAAVTTMIADGLACRTPNDHALHAMMASHIRVLEVSDAEVSAAMRLLFRTTHNVAEGAGAAALAGLLKDHGSPAGVPRAVVLSGGNVDARVFADVLNAAPTRDVPMPNVPSADR